MVPVSLSKSPTASPFFFFVFLDVFSSFQHQFPLFQRQFPCGPKQRVETTSVRPKHMGLFLPLWSEEILLLRLTYQMRIAKLLLASLYDKGNKEGNEQMTQGTASKLFRKGKKNSQPNSNCLCEHLPSSKLLLTLPTERDFCKFTGSAKDWTCTPNYWGVWAQKRLCKSEKRLQTSERISEEP